MGKEELEEAIEVLEQITTALGCGLFFTGVQNLMNGYENDDPELKEQGVREVIKGAGRAAWWNLAGECLLDPEII